MVKSKHKILDHMGWGCWLFVQQNNKTKQSPIDQTAGAVRTRKDERQKYLETVKWEQWNQLRFSLLNICATCWQQSPIDQTAGTVRALGIGLHSHQSERVSEFYNLKQNSFQK